MVVDPGTGAWRLTLKRTDLPSFAGGTERVILRFGKDAAFQDVDWKPRRRAGEFSYP